MVNLHQHRYNDTKATRYQQCSPISTYTPSSVAFYFEQTSLQEAIRRKTIAKKYPFSRQSVALSSAEQ